jgi:hypothetical protein
VRSGDSARGRALRREPRLGVAAEDRCVGKGDHGDNVK